MHLKNLTVYGFKSFPDKTCLTFLPGITAIVGPNGCGKSNVADAVRWVLGEQSAKALRGSEMADVIFNGADGRKPLGLAEVSLTIGGVDQDHLKAAGVELAYDEVTITRRVFRDGGSEYFINRTPCRLRDIQQLFMGTGVGRTSYSIMAQGNITQILSSKPEDRRLVFEEAAGITRFKAQKKEALRKLESTEQNLLRVADLIREVKRQIISLQRQAGKARRYKQYLVELQHLDTQLARHQLDLFQGELRGRHERLEQLRTELDTCTNQAMQGENELAQLRDQLAEQDHRISESRQQGLQLKNECDRHEHRIQFNEERLRELAAQNTQALSDIAQAEERRFAAEQELAGVNERLAASQAKRDRQRVELEARSQALAAVEDGLRSRQEALRQAQSEAFAVAQRLSRLRNELNTLDLQKQGNSIRLEKLSAEKVQLEEERARLEARLQAFARETELEQEQVSARRLSLGERQQRLRELQQELGQLGAELDTQQRQQTEVRSQLTLLEQLEAAHEGFDPGALAALRSAAPVLGTLADRLRVPGECVPAIESALGHHLQLLLTAEPDSAQQVLSELSAQRRGRASIAPLALRNGHDFGSVAELPVEHRDRLAALNCRPALSVVEVEESVRPLVGDLLGRTQIAPDLETATVAWRETGGAFDFVTAAGAVLSRHGVYTGGVNPASGQAPASILGRKNQMTALQAQRAILQETVSELSRRKGGLNSEQTALQAGLQEAQTDLRAREVALATRQGEFNALQNGLRVLHQKIDTVVYEVQNLAAQEREGAERRAALAEQLRAVEQQEGLGQAQLAELGTALEDLRGERENAHAALTDAKVALATEEQLSASFRSQQRPLEQRLQELDQLVQQRRRDIETVLQRRSQAEAENVESRSRMAALEHEREQLNQRLVELETQRETLATGIAAREEALRGWRRHLTELQEQRAAVEVEVAQKEMAVQNLRERIQQKYQVDLDQVRSECISITFAAEGPAKVVTLTPEEMAAAGVSTDWEAVAEQVATLQRRLEEMGPVNLVAIEEYEETEQRHQFLSTQHDDLVKAKQQLVDVINRVNTQTREMFTDTFNRIRENFQAIFVEIFGGGKADLRLVDEGDVLESGIEIVARPPGKQLQSISLLSGGEQTMTAVALLFAIYQVKPSPFCVLDELDAPLDESNINRFVRLLQRFLAHSQFVIITHNKRTIAMADVLYGITMQEQGVSKIVSVKFHKSGDQAIDHAPQPLEEPAAGPSLDEEEDREREREETLELVGAD
ncbi:MAG: chromosome segregation protein SMC [Verrucomicrobia bacterium]|nr:chromosome segregation protein SMC [Verrucomicrobiota bacterium]